ncbi:MAG: ankyrin repeat domain-containing protein, partial [Synergistaceae bacterium]|nr:ankyrin repeat domain-containing protein [Synergistaceae bacterium]
MKKIGLVVFCLFIFALSSAAVAAEAAMEAGQFFELCQNGTAEEIERAIEAGADVNLAGEYMGSEEVTPLMLAAYLRDEAKVLSLLLEAGADVNAEESDGSTALMYAVEGRKPKNILLLLEAGADAYVVNSHGNSALSILPGEAPGGIPEWEAAVWFLKGFEGLWLKCPVFPPDAKVIFFNDNKDTGLTIYLRSLGDGLVNFSIRRQEIEKGPVKTPDDVRGWIETLVSNANGDEGSIEVITDASQFS